MVLLYAVCMVYILRSTIYALRCTLSSPLFYASHRPHPSHPAFHISPTMPYHSLPPCTCPRTPATGTAPGRQSYSRHAECLIP